MTITPENRLKRIRYRAEHRGFKEADLLIGGFARDRLPALGEAWLDRFEDLLELNDQDLYGWIMETKPAPANLDHELIALIRDYANDSGPARG